jgi:hypothetical protein
MFKKLHLFRLYRFHQLSALFPLVIEHCGRNLTHTDKDSLPPMAFSHA